MPLSGDLAFVGEADRNAAQLAIEEIKNRKDLKHQYEIVIVDDSFDAAKVVTVMNKFISVDKVNAVVSVGSTAGNVIAPLAESSKIPHIGLASDPVVAKGEYNFIHWTRPKEETTTMVQELKKRNIKKVAILGLNQQGFQALNSDFKEKASASGIIFVEEMFNSGQTDFRTAISKLQKENPEIYILGAFDPEIGIIGKQIQALGIKTPLTSIESFGITADPTSFEGQWFVDSTIPTGPFVTKYQEKFGKAPGPAAPNVYDAIQIFVNAFESASGSSVPSGEKVVRKMSDLKGFEGTLGKLTVSPEGEFISQPTVKMIKDGKAVLAN